MADPTVPSIQVHPDPATVARHAVTRVAELLAQAIELGGTGSLCLAGGSTPKAMYELFAKGDVPVDWSKVHVFFGDERTVPPDHADSNYRMAKQAFLDAIDIPATNVHRMRGEADPEEAAGEYDALLRGHFGDDRGMDVMLLGMGDDGHTASLFPHTTALDVTDRLCVSNRVDKLDTTRITLTVPFINRSGQTLVLVTGENKTQVLDTVLTGEADPREHPILLINPPAGTLHFSMDTAAAGM
ncbi:MAG: 6-phosphogluconolactonase [Planctomycetota bacterium]